MRRYLPRILLNATGLWLVLLTAGCNQAARVRWAEHRPIPTEGLGHTLPAQGQGGNPPHVRYDGIYVAHTRERDGRTFYMWYRFWPEGRVLFSDWVTEHPPTTVDAEEFRGTAVGRYCVVDGAITIEVYQRVDEGWNFVTYDGRVEADGGAFTLHRVRYEDWRFWLPNTHPFDPPIRYEFTNVGELNRTPDW
jgi:hypothetical protein